MAYFMKIRALFSLRVHGHPEVSCRSSGHGLSNSLDFSSRFLKDDCRYSYCYEFRVAQRDNEGKEEGVTPGSVGQKLDVPLDSHSYLLSGKQPMSTSAKEGCKQLSTATMNPHRIN